MDAAASDSESSSLPLYLLDPPETTPQPDSDFSRGASPAAESSLDPLPVSDRLIADAQAQHHANQTEGIIFHPHFLSISFRHSGWDHNRLLVYRALTRTDQPQSRQRNFANCGSDAYVLRSTENPNVYRLAGSACHDRFCLPCQQERSQTIARNVLDLVAKKRIRFLTLTLKASTDPLESQLHNLYSAFQALRRRKLWTDKVTGGVAFLEVTWSDTHNTWHPHFHVLIEGNYLPQQQLKTAWYAITGDSFVVDIRSVRDLRTAARYVTKYASKPFNNTFLNRQNQLDEIILALKGRKLLVAFGSWKSITLTDTPSEGSWEHVAPLETIIVNAAHGDSEANTILRNLTDKDLTPLFARAPPLAPVSPAKRPDISQLTFFAAWQADGTCIYPNQKLENNRTFQAP